RFLFSARSLPDSRKSAAAVYYQPPRKARSRKKRPRSADDHAPLESSSRSPALAALPARAILNRACPDRCRSISVRLFSPPPRKTLPRHLFALLSATVFVFLSAATGTRFIASDFRTTAPYWQIDCIFTIFRLQRP